jgi:tetratricopeptide (TPR) repeat protein
VDLNRANLLCEWSRFEEAEALLQELVQRDPQNDAAHLAYNQLLYVLKREEKFLASYELAPRDTKLRLGKATLLHHAERLAEAEEIYADILADEPDNHDAVTGRAAILAKLGRHAQALECLQQAAARAPGDYRLFTGIAGAALQGGDPERAAAMAEIAVAYSPHDQHMLALLGSAWRLMGDERDELLNGYDELIQVFDLDPPPGFSDMAVFNAELNGWLGTMHPSNREPVHQSLRVGNQTWGKIFGAGHDLVERAKLRISEAMDRYIAGLRPRDGKPFSVHPFTGRRRQGFAFTGSWSSRLGDCGYHVNHIHPRGWISSCYYVGVPEAVKDAQSRQGWIKFGEPRFEIGLKARRTVQPVPGRLVLFPSYMWHGTIPFHGEARTTIAFDAVPR